MPLELHAGATNFEAGFRTLLGQKREASVEVTAAVAAILEQVRLRGDAALADYSRRFDSVDLERLGLRFAEREIAEARALCDPDALAALEFAKERIEAYHLRQRPQDVAFTDPLGVELGWRWSAVESVGLYVPGATPAIPRRFS